MMLEGALRDITAMGWPQSQPIIDELRLPRLVPRTRLDAGLIGAIILAIVVRIAMTRTLFGFEVDAVGANIKAARFAGISTGSVLMKAALISGGIAGLGGVCEVAGRAGYLTLDMAVGYGFIGIVIAMLAQLDALAVIIVSILVAALIVGGDSMSRVVGVPTYMTDVVVRRGFAQRVASDSPGSLSGEMALMTGSWLLDILASQAFWIAVSRIAMPLTYGTLGALLCERSGVLNLGIEGIMVAGAFSGWFTVYCGYDLSIGLLVASLVGAAFGVLHALLTVPLGLSQHVTGLGITMLASNLSFFAYRVWLPNTTQPPAIHAFQPLQWFAGVPYIGDFLAAQTAPMWLVPVPVLLIAYILKRTPIGLAIRTAGREPFRA